MKKILIFLFSLFVLGLASCNNPVVTSKTTTSDTIPTSLPDIVIGDESSTGIPSSSVEPTTSTTSTTIDDSTINPTTNGTTTNTSSENTTSTSSDGIDWDPTIYWP